MKVAIMSRNRKLYSTRRLIEAARLRGVRTRIVDPLRYIFMFGRNQSPTDRPEHFAHVDLHVQQLGGLRPGHVRRRRRQQRPRHLYGELAVGVAGLLPEDGMRPLLATIAALLAAAIVGIFGPANSARAATVFDNTAPYTAQKSSKANLTDLKKRSTRMLTVWTL